MIEPILADLGRAVLHRQPESNIIYAGVVDGWDEHNVFVRFGDSEDTTAIARGELNWPINGHASIGMFSD